jgi:DNA-binding NarL/FixJ family response regulator
VTRVLVAGASAVTRAGLEAILARDPALTVVGDAAATSSFAEEVAELEPDVVLVELAEAGADAVAMVRVLGVDADERARASPAIVVLTDEEDAGQIAELLDAGARAIMPRDAGASQIIAAISSAAAGLIVLAPEWSGVLRRALSAERSAPGGDGNEGRRQPLTARELEVLRMIAEGLANKQIAARLGISEHTVKFHVGSVFTKIGASTRAEAVTIGARRGLIVL